MDRLLDTQPTSVLFYPDARKLLQFRHTDQIVSLINRAFSEQSKDYMQETRIRDIETFVRELGEGTFSVVLSSSPAEATEIPTIYGVASARPYKGDKNLSTMNPNQGIWVYRTPPDEDLTGVERWELKIMAVEVTMQRQGLGDYMLNLLNMEILRRFRSGQRAGSGMTRCQTVHTTMVEVNLAWYEKRGYQLRSQIPVAVGQFGSDYDGGSNYKAFHTCCMSKFIA